MAIPVELLLGNKPKYACMEECRCEVQAIKEQTKLQREELEMNMHCLEVPDGLGEVDKWEEYMIQVLKLLTQWHKIASEEVRLLETCIHNMPDSPVLSTLR